MKQNPVIEAERERLRRDYEQITGSPFAHFYDPILHVDEDIDLCMGHIINQAMPNSCRKVVLQNKKLDGFFGSTCEEPFLNVLKGKQIGSHGIFANKDLHKRLKPCVEIDGRRVQHYILAKDKDPDHAGVRLVNNDGTFVDIALKVNREFNFERSNVQIAVDYNALPEATGALIKAAHLSMFRIYDYKYVFHTTGYFLAKILQRYFCEVRDSIGDVPLREVLRLRQIGESHFTECMHMIVPLEKYDTELLRGTVEDRRVLSCIGSSGHPFAFGVLVRFGHHMFIVFLPPDEAESMGTYDSFVRNEKESFMAKVFEFVPASNGIASHWETDPSPPFKLELRPTER